MNALTQTALELARGYVGIREIGGNNRGPEIERWLANVGRPPGDPWCMAFAWSVVDEACRRIELPNPIPPCASVVRMWESLPDGCKLAEPVVGCWAFHRDADNPRLGHVGFIDALERGGTGTFSIEGNSNGEGSRTGGGVWRHTPRLRPLSYWSLGFADYSSAAPVSFVTETELEAAQ
jgi:hypothetical protein